METNHDKFNNQRKYYEVLNSTLETDQ